MSVKRTMKTIKRMSMKRTRVAWAAVQYTHVVATKTKAASGCSL